MAEKAAVLNVYQRINKVRENNDYIKKEKRIGDDDSKFSYLTVTHDQVTHELRKDMLEQGIIVEPHLVSERTVQETMMVQGFKKNPIIRVECVYDVQFVNMDDPKDRASVPVLSHAIDAGDKAPGKALSYAVKMAILKLFFIETGEDDEARREAERDVGAKDDGLSESAITDWITSINDLKGKTVKELEEASTAMWTKIAAACDAKNDGTAKTKLRARLTAKFTALRKPLLAAEKKAAEGAK